MNKQINSLKQDHLHHVIDNVANEITNVIKPFGKLDLKPHQL